MINEIKSANLANLADMRQPQQFTPSTTTATETKQENSIHSKLQQHIQEILAEPWPDREAIVNNIKTAYENNQYQIDYHTIAENILLEYEE